MATNRHLRIVEAVRKITGIIERGHDARARVSELMAKMNNQDIAVILDIHPEDRLFVFHCVSHERYGAILDLVNNHTLRSLTGRLSDHDLAQIIDSSPSIVSQKVASTIERPRLNQLIPIVTDDKRQKNLQSFVNYPERSVGRIMQTEILTVQSAMTVKEALHEVENFNVLGTPVYQVYVLNGKGEFVGAMPISELLRGPSTAIMGKILLQKPPLIGPQTTQRRVAQLFQEHDLIEAPVTADKQLIGRVLVDDVLDIIQQEFTEDLQKFAGITADETMETSVMQSSRKRLPWMVLNIVLYLVAVSVIMPFQEIIAVITALAVIMPVVSNVGGNVGIQAISVSIRTLAANRPDWRLAKKELIKETRVGLINGTILGLVVGIVAYIWFGNGWLGVVALAALLINVILGSIVGGVLPIILKRLNKDPAMMGGAVLTTITDFCGFLVFLSLARAFVHLLV